MTLFKVKTSFKVSTAPAPSLELHLCSYLQRVAGREGGSKGKNPKNSESIITAVKTNASGDGQKQATPVICTHRY